MQAAAGQIPGISIATWPLTQTIGKAPQPVQVQAIIAAIFCGDVSPETRNALDEDGAVTGRTSTLQGNVKRLTQVLGRAFGAPEFQRR